ncbi:hypothetical protein PSACC_00816 [Paramicrosporidium saccamoebae]|uniref:SGS domain-containing protein n=1 Tax=Paramicrosporidium saccamoebae TaxID=1246581 RepID=A0A2H9TNT8_9FUNG|nr:hypothetical protein PSACC_00816 [Paramicrosporidium saccamoebae]
MTGIRQTPQDAAVAVKFHSPSLGEFQREFSLFGAIAPSESSYFVGSVKLELNLQKTTNAQWKSLEKEESDKGSSSQAYPSSSRVKHDWEELEKSSATETADDPETTDAFFKKLYANATEETRRAMMKSFVQLCIGSYVQVESGGTVLSTNWDEFSIIMKKLVRRPPPFTQPCRRLPPKIPNPPPNTCSEVQRVSQKCIFFDLSAKARPTPKAFTDLPPLLKNPVGRVVKPEELQKMKMMREKGCPITSIAGEFGISRAYVIKHVLTEAEQKQAREELVERIDSLSINEKRGWLMRYKIREHRRDLCKYCSRRIRSIRCRRDTPKKTPLKKLRETEPAMVLLFRVERLAASALSVRRESIAEPRKMYHERRLWKKAHSASMTLADRIGSDCKKSEMDHWNAAVVSFNKSRQYASRRILIFRNLARISYENKEDVAFLETRCAEIKSLTSYCQHMGADVKTEDDAMDGVTFTEGQPTGGEGLERIEIYNVNWLVEKESLQAVKNATEATSQPKELPALIKQIPNLANSNRVKKYLGCLLKGLHLAQSFQSMKDDEMAIVDIFLKRRPLKELSDLAKKGRHLSSTVRTLCCSEAPKACVDEARKLEATLSGLSGKVFKNVAFEGVSNCIDSWLKQTKKIQEAMVVMRKEGLEMTPMGPHPVSQLTSVLERLDKFQLYRPASSALLDDKRASQMIPMKPIFYDLAYDLLTPPNLSTGKTGASTKEASKPSSNSPSASPSSLLAGLWKR